MGVRSARPDAIDDEPLEGQDFNVFRPRGAKIARIHDYRRRLEALAAAGAEDPAWR